MIQNGGINIFNSSLVKTRSKEPYLFLLPFEQERLYRYTKDSAYEKSNWKIVVRENIPN